MSKSLITCDCLGSQSIDSHGLSQATGCDVRPACTALCTTQLNIAEAALSAGDTIICCTQEAAVFEELAADLGAPPPATVDLRDRAGWSDDPASKLPKMSALIAEAQIAARPNKTVDVISHGTCLILGPQDVALDAAAQLSPFLGVTVLVDGTDIPSTRNFDVVVGKLRHASGALGQFDVILDAVQQVEPGGRGTFTLSDPQDGGLSQCDVILDLRGGQPLFPAPEKREGYLRADPKHPAGIAAAVLAASHLIGTFEKPLYVVTEPILCAHSRAEQTGCTRCLDLCPTGAIVPDGDHVKIDPMICAGCGACSAVCPSGAVSYDAPPVDQTMRRVQTLAQTYLEAGGVNPRLLVHDAHGAEMIRLAARFGRGLPADVIPLEMPELGAFGHAEMVAAIAAGFGSAMVLPGPGVDMTAMTSQISLACAIAGAEKVHLLDTTDPDAMSDALFEGQTLPSVVSPVRPMGTRRQITRQAAKALNPDVAQITLPEDAPYGAVVVDTDACTLCLSCTSLCPSGALGDNPDLPQLRFQEDACLQCGLCAKICPEDAITYEARLDLSDAALTQQVLNEEEPFACIKCGSLFGVKSTVERITEKLRDHAMFDGDKLAMIQMCDNCRVDAQFHSDDNPFAGGERPRTRTTDDYLSKRRDH